MQIKVDRTECSGSRLVFTITCTDPAIIEFSKDELGALISIEVATKLLSEALSKDSEIFRSLQDSHHEIKERIFDEMLDQMKETIRKRLDDNFRPICQEVYNWIYDHQDGYVKNWMMEFNPERTTYYFDNDPRMTSQFGSKQPDDKFDDEEDEDDDE